MKKRIQILYVLILIQVYVFLLAPTMSCAQSLPQVVIAACSHVQNNEFDKVSSLYLLPSYFSGSELLKEKKGITEALKLLSLEFGGIHHLDINQDNVRWINLEIFGGDVDFVKSHPNFEQYVFKTTFSKLGEGFIIIRIYRNDGNPMLRSVGYALKDSPQNREKMGPIANKLMQLMIKQQETHNT